MSAAAETPVRTTRHLISILLYSGWSFVGVAMLSITFFVVPFVTGLIQKSVFDTLSGHAPVGSNITLLLVALVVTAIVSQATGFLNMYGFARVEFSSIALLRRNMLDHILHQPGARALPASPGEAITRFRDDVAGITESLRFPLFITGEVVFSAAALVLMLRINARITLVVLIPLLVVVILSQVITSRLQGYRRASRVATGGITDFLGELFGAVQAVKVAGAEEHVLGRFDELNTERLHNTVRDAVFESLLFAIYFNTAQLGMGIMLLVASGAMRSGTFTLGDFALFVTYLERLTGIPFNTGRLLARVKQARVSFERMGALLHGDPTDLLVRHVPTYLDGDFPPVPFDRKTATDRFDRLDVQGLTFRFPDTERGIVDAGFSVRRGQLVIVTGRIGSGKSTLLRTLLGLLPRERGTIAWNGETVDDPATWFIPPRVAYTSQVPRLFSDTLRNNILLGLPADEVDLDGALDLAVLAPDVGTMEAGLDTVVGPRGVRLSGGQVQRAAAARMFVRDAELLVVDDLSSALDVETENLLWNRIFTRGQSTVLAVSHRRAALRRANHILVLDNSRIIDQGTLGDLLERCEEMRRLWAGARA